MSTSVKEKKKFRLRSKIGKLIFGWSSKLTSAFSFTESTSSEASLSVSDPELLESSKIKSVDFDCLMSNPLKPKPIDISQSIVSSSARGSDSTMIFKQQSSVEAFKESPAVSDRLMSSDPCILDSRQSLDSSFHISRFSSRETSRLRLASIDEMSPVIQLDSMNLQFNVMPLAIQPEKIERDNRAKRTKSAQSRKSLKSAPSLANMLDEEELSNQNSETSFSVFDDLSDSFTGSKSSLSKSFGPKELRSLMYSLKIEERNQTSGSIKCRKNKKLSWSDELSGERFRSLSDVRFESKKSPQKNGFNSLPLENKVKETKSIFVQDKEAIFVNQLGEKECSSSQINQYHIIREIGSGAFGTVFLSKSALNGQYFALKMISKSRLIKKMRWKAMLNGPGQFDTSEELRKEIAVLKKLSRHPNINHLYEVLDSAADDNIYLIFELCEYGAIMKLQQNKAVTPYNEDMARKILRDVLLGLEYSMFDNIDILVHYKKIIHRDIKPENLLFSGDFSVVIADFGISHAFENEEAAISDTNASPAFSPPEAFNEKSGIPDGRAADVWSLGITLYALVHGRCPFDSDDILELAQQIKYEEIKYGSHVSSLLIDLLLGMLKKDPADRLTIAEIKVHPWVTQRGNDPMLSTEENCIYEEVTDEEVKTAFKPAVKLAGKIINSLRRRLSTKRRTDGDNHITPST